MKWKQFLCAFTWHSYVLLGARGMHAVYRCSFCEREDWRSIHGGRP